MTDNTNPQSTGPSSLNPSELNSLLSALNWLPSSTELEAISLKKSFSEFVRQAWHLVEPSQPLIWAWYLQDECDHLQALVEGRFHKIIFNVPPGSAKSSIVACLFPCWIWARDPSRRFLFASHKASLALRDSVRRRYILTSEWFKSRWPRVTLTEDQNQKGEFHNTAKGFMISMGRGGSTGFRGHYLILDDPNNTTEMESEVQRESCLMWIDHQWSTRGDGDYREVLIQQRSHMRDVTGHYLSHGGYVHYKVPMEYDPSIRAATDVGIHDPRTTKGELLNEAIFSRSKVDLLKRKLGPYGTSGQLQQEPAPQEGGIIKRAWIRSYEEEGEWIIIRDYRGVVEYKIRAKECLRFATVDLAVTKKDTDKADPDYTVIGSWCVFSSTRGPILLLLDLFRDRLEGPDIRKEIEKKHDAFSFSFIAVEQIAGFIGLGQEFKRAGLPIRDISKAEDAFLTLEGDKPARAYGATPLMADGRFYAPLHAPWLGDYIRELTVFPNYGHDDQVDVTTSAVAIAEKVKPWDAGLEEAKPEPTIDSQGPEYESKPASVFDEMRGSNDGRY